jgi:hydrogenase maturation protease
MINESRFTHHVSHSGGKFLRHTLVAGFGNLYRRDDGVGRAVVNALRERLGRPSLDPLDDGFDDLGHRVDMVVLHQLVPELAETAADYDLVIFVDAHVADLSEPLREEHIAASYRASFFVSHQTYPSTVLDLAQRMQGHTLEGVLLSLRGYDFDFGEGLSPETAALVPLTVARILALIEEAPNAPFSETLFCKSVPFGFARQT